MTYSVRKHEDEYTEASLEVCVKRFLAILDKREEKDSGNVIQPVYISSCRVLLTMEIGDILNRMKVLTNGSSKSLAS